MRRWIICIFIFLLWLPSQMMQLMAQEDMTLDIESKVAYVYNINSDKSMYEKKADEKIYPASMTKIMTVYTALQYVKDTSTKIRLTNEVFRGLDRLNASVAGFTVNDEVSIEDLLYGIMLASGADASRAIAIYVAGSEQGFVQLMNKQALRLGLTHTRFMNTTGLHDPNHYTTAKEMAIILKEAIKNSHFMKIFTAKTHQTKAVTSNEKGISLQSTMWKYIDTIDADTSLFKGGKTGFTLEAGHCLASLSTTINGAQYIVITAQGAGSFQDTLQVEDAQKIYTYLKDNYYYHTVFKKGEHIIDIPVKRMFGTTMIPYVATEDIQILVRKDDQIQVEFESKGVLKEPVKEGDIIGDVVLLGKYGEVKRWACASTMTLYPTGIVIAFVIGIGVLGSSYWIYRKRKQRKNLYNSDELVFDIIHKINQERKE